jgi:hypothetical protein
VTELGPEQAFEGVKRRVVHKMPRGSTPPPSRAPVFAPAFSSRARGRRTRNRGVDSGQGPPAFL